jgi:hypothetical protein
MGKSLQVKVRTETIIKSLERSLAEREKRMETQIKAELQYEKEKKAYEEALVKLVKTGKVSITDATVWNRHRLAHEKVATINMSGEVAVSALPKEPTPVENDYRQHQHNTEKEEIENALRILKMTEQEFVNASTIASVSKFL